jgi:hypothetical protein
MMAGIAICAVITFIIAQRRRRIRTLSVVGKASRRTFRIVLVPVVVLDPFPPASSERRILSNPQPPLSRPPSSSIEQDCDVPTQSCSFIDSRDGNKRIRR